MAQAHPLQSQAPCNPAAAGCSPGLSSLLPWDTAVLGSEPESCASGDLGRFLSDTDCSLKSPSLAACSVLSLGLGTPACPASQDCTGGCG